MRKVKIVLVEEFSDDDYCKKIVRDSISDWEEIEEEDLTLLKNNLYRLVNLDRHGRFSPALIVADDQPIQVRLKGIRDEIEKEKKRAEAAKLKRLESARKKKESKAEKEKRLFEELSKKYAK